MGLADYFPEIYCVVLLPGLEETLLVTNNNNAGRLKKAGQKFSPPIKQISGANPLAGS